MLTGYLGRFEMMSDRLGNFNGKGQEIMQSCTADNVSNKTTITFRQFGEQF